jgi:hypothetical protein
MVELVINLPDVKLSKKLLKELKADIDRTVRLRMARKMLLSEWDKRFSASTLTDEDSISLGRQANKQALKVWKDKGWL